MIQVNYIFIDFFLYFFYQLLRGHIGIFDCNYGFIYFSLQSFQFLLYVFCYMFKCLGLLCTLDENISLSF